MYNPQGKKIVKKNCLSYSLFNILVEKGERKKNTYLGKSKRNEQTSAESRLYILLSRSMTTSVNIAIVFKFDYWFLRN